MNPSAPYGIIGRFAPSPTGPLHMGSLVAAVGSYLLAKRGGGLWLMRMEDLDAPRVLPGMADDILRTLEVLGLHWDGEVVVQSRRTSLYEEAFRSLCDLDAVYPCGCSRAEIARASSAPHGEEALYPGTCRSGLPAGRSARGWRLRVASQIIFFDDGVIGPVREELDRSCGDFIVRRADGPFAYHLAAVVDDAAMGVTQIARGADLLSSTPRQIYLQRLLGYSTPHYFHLPLVTGPGGAKLSKRDNAVSVGQGRDLEKEGGRLIAAALRFLGQHVPPLPVGAPAEELLRFAVAAFDASLVPATAGELHLS